MNITDIKIRKLLHDGRLRAVVSITLDNAIAVHDIKVIEGPDRLFVAMPSRREENGTFRDIVHPISIDGRQYIETEILSAYEAHLKAKELENEQNEQSEQNENNV
ncbi:MAG: septation regulator SpoVG [Oscillospiraceae bacterium]